MGSHSAVDVAAEIRKRVPGVAVKKLHKLLYYCQAHHVTAFGRPLFSETISAWDMGPVVGQLWWLEKQGPGIGFSSPAVEPLGEAELNTIGYVVSRYGKLSGLDLERLTHSEAPWIDADRARQALGQKSHRITPEALAEFFRVEAQADEPAEPALDVNAVHAWLKGAVERRSTQSSEDTPESLLARTA